MAPRKRLGQVLMESGVIDEHQLQSALGHQKQWGGKLGAILVQKGFCKEDDVVTALTKHLNMQRVRLAEVKVDPRALKCVSKALAEKLHVLPYEISGSGRSEVVTIAMSDPTDLSAVDQLAFHTGKRLKTMLAGDSEIVAAIHAHYGGGEEKKESTDKVARPGPPQAGPSQQGAPAGSVAGFPRRIDPPAAAGAGPSAPARAAPYIPPPIPTAKPAPAVAQKLDEIEPDEPMAPAAPAAMPPPALELPDVEGQDFGLEPIAAHSQFGDAVAGREEVAGEGAPGDEVEGLVSASLAHEGAAQARQMDGLDAIAAQEPAFADAGSGWTGPILTSDAPAVASGAWKEIRRGQTGWDVSAPAPSGGWAAEPAPPVDRWSAPGGESWGLDAPGEALPADAILGTAPILAAAENGGAAAQPEPAAPESPILESPSSEPPVEMDAGSFGQETEAPDAWASMDDPLAAQAAVDDPLESRPASEDSFAGSGSLSDPLAAPADATGSDPREGSVGHASTDEFANPLRGRAGDVDAGSPAADPQGNAWVGGTLDGGTPLSPADLGTLASIGVDPGDGVGALRLLAVLIRILNRSQLIEPDELREEIRESQAQGSASASKFPESRGGSRSGSVPPVESAET
jgi:Type II secretion system (T2SS), protein E, N-terminal domain